MGSKISIYETSLSNGELYTVLTNKAKQDKKGCLAAIIAGTKSEEVIAALQKMPQEALDKVEEITLDMSESMRKIARTCFVKASQVIDRFDVMKLAFDATQEIRIKHRREAIQAETDAKSKAKILEKEYIAERFDNGDTRKELLARSRYPLFKSGDK